MIGLNESVKLGEISGFYDMLPESHCQRYQEFQQRLERFQALASQSDLQRSMLKLEALAVQKFFQDQVRSLDLEELEAAAAHRSHTYQVEMDKQLRLLNMDVMFLQTARQSATGVQRLRQVSDRVSTLIRYCGATIGVATDQSA